MSARTLALLLSTVLAGCGAGTSARAAPPIAAATVALTCPDGEAEREVEVRALSLVTTRRGVRWFYGTERGRPVLTWLRGDGSLGSAPLEIDAQACAAEGADAIRCFRTPMRQVEGAIVPLRSVSIELSETPLVGPVERWEGGPFQYVVSAATDGRVALVVYRDVERAAFHELTLWDVSMRRLLEGPERVDGELEVLAAWCEGTCTLLAIRRDEEGRRVVAITAPGFEERVLTDSNVFDAVAFRSGAAHLVAALQLEGAVHLTALGSDGSVRAQPPSTLALGAGGRLSVLDDGLVAARDSEAGWSALTISSTAAIAGQTALETDAVGLKGARVGEGVAVAALSGQVRYDDIDGMGLHSWSFDATERFFDADRTTAWRSILGAVPSGGDGRGGYEVEWLVRPGRAAILLMGTGDTGGSARLIPIRRRCP